MANKKRKLTKETERLRLTRAKYQKERASVLRITALVSIIAAALIAIRVFLVEVPLDAIDACIMAAILAPVYICSAVVVSNKNADIRATDKQIIVTQKHLQKWEQHLQER